MAEKEQNKGAVGAGLLTGGAALLGTPLLGAFAAGFQIGYGGGMIVKAAVEARRPDPRPDEPASLKGKPDIGPLPGSSDQPDALANSANGAMNNIGKFITGIRALGIALNRHHSALIIESNSAGMQLNAAYEYFHIAREALQAVSKNLHTLSEELRDHEDGSVIFNVTSLYRSFQKDLYIEGFPRNEQPYIQQFDLSREEQQQLFIDLLRIPPDEAVEFFGKEITFQMLVRQLSENATEIAEKLAVLVRLPARNN